MKAIVCCLLFCACGSSFAQVKYGHAFSGEFGGIGIGISAQYDYIFLQTDKGFFDARAGIGGWANYNFRSYSFSHAVTYNFGSANHFLEGGIGACYALQPADQPYEVTTSKYFAGPMIGYRSISANGFQFRIYANLFMGDKNQTTVYGGIGFGKTFLRRTK